jgi:LuxR family maltose regulon positive regulatory protein
VRAPAGYGKSTLVAAAAAELDWQYLYYRLDRLDADPESFLRSLAMAARLRWPGLGETQHEAPSPASGSEAAIELLIAMLADQLAQAEAAPTFIILDDYDSVEPQFDATAAALLRLLPPTVHLVVLGRARPTFATAKLELDGGLGEITYRDLLLDQDQTAAAFEEQTGLTPSPAAREELRDLTQGWAAGVVLAGKAVRWGDPEMLEEQLEGLAFERAVFPHFEEEVWKDQPAEVQQFLRRTCCLESMTVALAEDVSGSSDARRLLAYLLERELFTFAGASGTVHYHPLFRRFLERQTIREEGADTFRSLLRSSADALARHGLFALALDLYLTLGDPHAPLEMLKRDGAGLLDDCSEALLRRWIDALRAPSSEEPGWTALLDGRRLLQSGHLTSAREQLERARDSFGSDQAGRFLALRALAQRCYETGEDEQAIEHAGEALALADGPREEAECLSTLAKMLSTMGRWQDLDKALAAFNALGGAPPALAAKMATLEAHRRYIAGDARGALAAAERALPLVRRHAAAEEGSRFLSALATLSMFNAQYARARQYLAKAELRGGASGCAKTDGETALTRAALLAQEGDPVEALAALEGLLADRSTQENGALLFESSSLRGTILRRTGRLSEASKAYEAACRAVDGGPLYDRLGVQLDLAFTHHLREADPRLLGQMKHVMDEAAHSRLLFQYAKARLYLAVLSTDHGGQSGEDLTSPCGQLVRLGHLDFLGQELVAHPEVARTLVAAEADAAVTSEALEAIAPQAGGPDLLAALALTSERAGELIVAAARQRLSAEQRRWMLTVLRRHPSKRVRDLARRTLLAGPEDRLFPELTPREEEILAAIAAGGTNQGIAEQCSLTLATVKTNVHRVLLKTGARGRLAAAVLYQQRSAADVSARDDRGPGAGQ